MLFSLNIHSPALTAAATWILKDGIGLAGSVVTGALINRGFDGDPKRWRFVSILLGQLSNLLSISTIAQPHFFLLFSALASTLSRVATSAHLSARARIYEGFVREGNIGDIMRASQTQATVANLLGLTAGLLSGQLLLDFASLLAVVLPTALLTQVFAYRSCQAVVLNTLNRQRAEIVLLEYLRTNKVFTPQQVAAEEQFVLPAFSAVPAIRINSPLPDYMTTDKQEQELKARKYIVHRCDVWFAIDASAEQVVQGFYEAIRQVQQAGPHQNASDWQTLKAMLEIAGWDISTVTFIDDKRSRLHY